MNFEDTYEYEDAREVYHRPRDIARFGTRPIAYDDPTLINQEQPNFADAEALRRTEQITNDAWREVFDAQPYNSFFMVSWLLHLAGRSAEDLWQNPRILRRYPVQEDDMDRDTIYALVSNGGRCTTFTIQVAQELEDRQDRGDLRGLQKFEWRYHDVGRHRIARCENTGLVIHSSSPQGFLTVPPGPAGMTLDLDTDDGVPRAETLIYSDGISKWKRLRDAEIKSLVSNMIYTFRTWRVRLTEIFKV
ncbi:uncharacterized protein M421DRAFT_191364 [Didymella exigua CBS 183.55]|uniref:Uncharacterized protein n=1 Tax=Didymella exigua CBS 183.55 TaxID=1150837 RepID=A0A6A5S161_9PLEO|nr:uncharacterized protein M421DRAFT_191364 [Didymella exigua CBS 183.55]KAF1933184.1 hypothetical protein M421DRAFT_191364 [Didymella exigua CBS 183.55]